MPRWQRIRAHHFITGGVLLIAVASFYWMLFKSLKHANDKLLPRLIDIEQHGPQ
jgi:ABC-type glycerol-3-phosphate transport system permease component